jgi:predicted membrane-bound mannosyltransferase
MVSALRVLSITLWLLIVPIPAFGLGARVTQFWNLPFSGDVLLIIPIALAAAAGGAAIFFVRLSLRRRIFAFLGYWLVASFVLFFLYPIIICSFTDCP